MDELEEIKQTLILGPGPTHGMRWAEWYASLMDRWPWMAEGIKAKKKGWLSEARLTTIASDKGVNSLLEKHLDEHSEVFEELK
jgi:hypothetical protein